MEGSLVAYELAAPSSRLRAGWDIFVLLDPRLRPDSGRRRR